MTKQIEKVNKTHKIEIRCTGEFKQMATRKADKAGHDTLSAWLTKLIQRAR